MGCCGHSNKKPHVSNSQPTSNLSPLDLLKIRLAHGDITIDEYEKIKAELQN